MDVLHAAEIVGLRKDFSLLDETTAMIMAHKSMCLTPKGIVAFVDIGHASMQVCFAEFKEDCSNSSRFESETSVNILYKGYSKSLGGRQFDKVLFNHFASKIRKKYNIDVSKNSSDCVRLSETCERLKINLSYNSEASFCIKKFSGSTDIKGSITRKEFEILSISILKKIEVALKNALSESGLNVQKVDSLEAIGKGCSIPAIIDILTKIFGKKERHTTYSYEYERQTGHSYEHVATGCYMHGAHLNITGMNKTIHNLTRALETSELVSSELNSQEENAKDSEKFLWRRAMEKEGILK
ncbi:heat shock 70 kDa protein 15-like [Carex rostrata]